jgi:hypothetical protein
MASLEAAIRAARNDPAEAESLYSFLVHPCRAGSVERARCILAEAGHPHRSAVTQRRVRTRSRDVEYMTDNVTAAPPSVASMAVSLIRTY